MKADERKAARQRDHVLDHGSYARMVAQEGAHYAVRYLRCMIHTIPADGEDFFQRAVRYLSCSFL